MAELNGKVALITGASRGIGNAIAQRFAAEGAKVILVASRLGAHGKLKGTLEDAVAAIKQSGGTAVAEVADLRSEESRADLIERASAHFGDIDILVNNAASMVANMPSLVSSKDRNLMHEINLNAPIELAQKVLPGMRRKGGGWILNISSATAVQPQVPYIDSDIAAHVIGAYGASKAALNRYSEALAHEVSKEHIYVNTLAPVSIVLTSGADTVRPIAEKNPKAVEPGEMMAEAALELCTQRHVGRVLYSRPLVHEVNRPVKSLDGTTTIGDAHMDADLDRVY